MHRIIAGILVLLLTSTYGVYAQTWQEWKSRSDKSLEQYDIGTAASNLEKAVVILEQGTDTGSYHQLHAMNVQLSGLYTTCMRYEKAVPLLKRIIAMNINTGENKEAYIHALTNLAAACIYQEEYDSAYLLLSNSDRLRKKYHAENKLLAAENEMTFSRYYMAIGRLDSAVDRSAQAGSFYKLLGKKYIPHRTLALSTAAKICMQMGDLHLARRYVHDFKDLLTSPYQSYHPCTMEMQINLAEYSAMQGKYKDALKLYAVCSTLIFFKLGNNNPLAIICWNNQGYNLLRLNRFSEALEKFTRSLEELRKKGLERSTMYFDVKTNEGIAYLMNSQAAQAELIFDSTLQFAEKKWGTQHSKYCVALYNKAMSYASLGRPDESARALILAGNIYRTELINSINGMPEKLQLNMYNMSEIFFQVVPSLVHLYRDKAKDSILLALYAEQSFLKGLIAYNKHRALSQIRNSRDSSLGEHLDKWTLSRQLLSDAYSKNKPRAYTDSLLAATTALEGKLMSALATFNEAQTDIHAGYAKLSGKLKKGEVAIEFLKYRLFKDVWTDSVFYAALVITPGSTAPVFVDLCTEQELLKLLHPYYADSLPANKLYLLYKDPRYKKPPFQQDGEHLYRMVWQPIDRYLSDKATVYVSPAGLLNLVAFPALPYKGRLLTDRYTVRRFHSLSKLSLDDSSGHVSEVELWGGINYGKARTQADAKTEKLSNRVTARDETFWEQLPATISEITGIKRSFEDKGVSVKVYKDTQATKQRFINTVHHEPYILHIATHGFYTRDTTEQLYTEPQFWSYNVSKSRDPLLRSGLVFAGANVASQMDSSLTVNSAIVTSYDIASMNLEKVRLATLSACETAMGDLESGEGVVGLQRALKLAGVNKMILTLWPVDDKKTQVFMNMLYKKIASGTPIPEAFLQTQRSIRTAFNDPQHWAGFLLVE